MSENAFSASLIDFIIDKCCILGQKAATMCKEEIEKSIRMNVLKNYEFEPGAFNDTLINSIKTAKALASAYWRFRSKEDIKRDAFTKVTKCDYYAWVKEAVINLKRPEVYN